MCGRVFMTASNPNLNPAPRDWLKYVDTCKKRLYIAFQVFTQGGITFLLETKSVGQHSRYKPNNFGLGGFKDL